MIASPDNPKIKHIQKLLSKPKFRKETREYIVESSHHLNDILETSPRDIQYLLYTTLSNELTETLNNESISYFEISDSLLKKCTDVKQSSGLIAVVHYPVQSSGPLNTSAFYLDKISNPRNLGAVIRNSAAFGLTTLYISPESVDPFHPESVRASAGTLNKVRVIEASLEEVIKENPTIEVLCLDSNATQVLNQASLSTPHLIILGSENGFSSSTLKLSKLNSYKIPLQNNVDSLNLAVTSGIIGNFIQLSKPDS